MKTGLFFAASLVVFGIALAGAQRVIDTPIEVAQPAIEIPLPVNDAYGTDMQGAIRGTYRALGTIAQTYKLEYPALVNIYETTLTQQRKAMEIERIKQRMEKIGVTADELKAVREAAAL